MISTAEFKAYIGETSTDYDAVIGTLIDATSAMIQTYCQRVFASASYREIIYGKDIQLKHYPVTRVAMVGVGMQECIGIKNTSTDAYAATVEVDDDTIQLVVLGGDNASDETLTLADYTTISALADAIDALAKGWHVATVDTWSPIELMPTGVALSALGVVGLKRPHELSTVYQLDSASGVISLPCDTVVTVRYTAGFATIPDDLKHIVMDAVKVAFDDRNRNTALQSEKIGDYSYTVSSSGAYNGALPESIISRLSAWRKYV